MNGWLLYVPHFPFSAGFMFLQPSLCMQLAALKYKMAAL